jgi:hypothetical protein
MATSSSEDRLRRWHLIAVGVATALALWLRVHGITMQLVIDDEWHALHKLQDATYSGIFNSFGLADHSIPLTLFYKWMADNFGIAEGRLRALQAIAGIAMVPACAWIAWGATRDRAVAALFAFLVAGAPFLVLWSRFARPYSISALLAVLCVAAIWNWRTHRTRRMAACAAVTAALATWFHPLMGAYPALGCLCVLLEDTLAFRSRPRAWRQSLAMGAMVALSMAVLLISPFIKDRQSLSEKAGHDHPDFHTYDTMLSLFWGGLPQPAYALALACTAWGLVVVLRHDRRLGIYLVVLGATPALVLTIVGASWINGGQNFGRYQLPLQPLLLFLGSVGAIALVRTIARTRHEAAAWFAVVTLSGVYLALNPAIAYSARLGEWYGDFFYHTDYRIRWLEQVRTDPQRQPPDFYRKLAAQPGGTIVVAPYQWEFPFTSDEYFATIHRQNVFYGMLGDVCKGAGRRLGEVSAGDRRFRFRRFVFLRYPASTRATGARYLVFNRDVQTRFDPIRPDCMDKLAELYGPPIEVDARIAVWDLQAPR